MINLDISLRLRLFLINLLTLASLWAQSQRLSEQSEIAIMTLGPYQPELYSVFGHSAIKVVDPEAGISWVFNYGVFDFEQENFYVNFAQGLMIYQLGLSHYEPFRDKYIREDRDVREQVLNLTHEEKQAFFNFLMNNYKPANREYLYHYVYDNCASKIPEVMEEIFGGQISYDTSYVQDGKTIRDLMHDYLGYQPWGQWMIDIGLGMEIDNPASQKEYMFLPDYVFKAFEGAKLGSKPLIDRTDNIYLKSEPIPAVGWLTPMNFFVLLFFVGGFITHLNMKRLRRSRWLDGLLFGFAGMVGLWLAFLWGGTAHMSKWNLDILWAIPIHFPIVFMMRKKSWAGWLRVYFLVTAVWYGILLLLWAILPEPLNMALVPFTLLLLLRAAYISYDLKKNQTMV